MPVKQPPVDVDAISTLDEAKHIISHLVNSLEIQREEIIELKKEIARLRQQPRKPQFEKTQQSFSATKLTKEKNSQWHKSSRGHIAIDQDIQLPEVAACVCGSKEFRTIKTTRKVVQGLVIKRNNTAYHGKKKACASCGKIYTTEIPEAMKGLSFDQTTQSLTSFLKFACRFTHPLLHRFFHEFGVEISYGELSHMLHRKKPPGLLGT